MAKQEGWQHTDMSDCTRESKYATINTADGKNRRGAT